MGEPTATGAELSRAKGGRHDDDGHFLVG